MRELGPEAAAYHREIGEHARRRGVELLIGVGELARGVRPRRAGRPTPRPRPTALAERLGAGDAVLVKGSRAVGLERVAERLAK